MRVTLPSSLTVPAESVAPTGRPSTVTVRLSPATAPTSPAPISRAISVSSRPTAGVTVSVGVSASGSTVNVSSVAELEVSPLVSTDVAVTVSWMSSVLFCGAVSVRPVNSSCVRVTLPSSLTVPADRTAPSGRPLTVTETVSEPSISVAAAEISSS